MLRAVRRTTRFAGVRRLASQPPPTPRRNWLPEIGLGLFTFGGTLYFLYVDRRAVEHFLAFKDAENKPVATASKAELYSEAAEAPRDQAELLASTKLGELEDDEALVSSVWGSNKCVVLLAMLRGCGVDHVGSEITCSLLKHRPLPPFGRLLQPLGLRTSRSVI